MASNNSYKSFNDSNNHNKINGYSNPYDNNYYDDRPLIQDDDDDFEEYDDYDEKEPSYQEGYEEEPNDESKSIETDGEDQGGTGLENENQGENSNEPQTLKEKYDAAKQKFEDTKEKARQTAENIKNAPQNIKNKANEVAANVKNAPENVRNRLNQAKTNIQNAPQNIKNGIKNAPQKAKEGAINQVNKAKESFNKKIKAKKEDVKKKIKKIKASIKVLGAVGGFLLGFAALMIPVILMAALYEALFGLTASGEGASHSNASSQYSIAEIEKKMIYVGDSRTNGLKSALSGSAVSFIAKDGSGYSWYVSDAKKELETKIENDKLKFVVLAFGVNDLHNIDNYINAYNSLISEHDKVNFFVMSVNPVDETVAKSYGYTVSNESIKNFNDKLQNAFGNKYIDVYSQIKGQISTQDGLHYKSESYLKVHDIVVNYIQKNSYRSGGDIANATYLEGGLPIPIIYQGDYPDVYLYPSDKNKTVKCCGCGFTSASMIVSYLTDELITPREFVDDWSRKYYVYGQGMSGDLPAAAAAHYGLGEVRTTTSIKEVVTALQEGHPVMSSQGTGLFTVGGHLIVLRGVTEDGKILVNDPNANNAINKNYNNRAFTQGEIDQSAGTYYIFPAKE